MRLHCRGTGLSKFDVDMEQYSETKAVDSLSNRFEEQSKGGLNSQLQACMLCLVAGETCAMYSTP